MSMQILYEYDIYMYQEFNIGVLQGYVLRASITMFTEPQ